MVRTAFRITCMCGRGCQGTQSSLGFGTRRVDSFTCDHFTVEVSATVVLGVLLGLTAYVGYTFLIVCACGRRWSIEPDYFSWGRNHCFYQSVCCVQGHHCFVQTQESNFIGVLKAISDYKENEYFQKVRDSKALR